MTDATIDMIAHYRGQHTVGWHYAAEVYEKHIPKERQTTEMAQYSGVLFGLAAVARPRVIVEIGAQHGISTRMWLAATEKNRGVVHSIDIDDVAAGADFDDIKATERWFFHHGRSQDIHPMESDLLYVDGDHSYEAVCSDMARHGVAVRDGGLVVLDDYFFCWPGKMRWLDERRDILDPIIVGPTAIVRVTPAKRDSFLKVFP